MGGSPMCTDDKSISDGVITIILDNKNLSSLDAAASILHEGIHAELFRFVDQAHNGEVNPNDRKRLFDLYKNFKNDVNWQDNNAQHTYMAENFVKPIARAIRELDNKRYNLNYYMGFGWEGLEAYDFKGILTVADEVEFARLRKIVNDNTAFNPKDCN